MSSSVSRPFSTPGRAGARRPLPRAASSSARLDATVGTPAWMQSWAMPEPIVPSPTTPTFSTVRRHVVTLCPARSSDADRKAQPHTARPASAPALIALTKSPGRSASPRTSTSGPCRSSASEAPRGRQPTAVATPVDLERARRRRRPSTRNGAQGARSRSPSRSSRIVTPAARSSASRCRRVISSMPCPTVGSISTIVTSAPAATSHSAVSQPGGAAADHGDALARVDRDAAVEDLLRVDHVRPADARDRRHERVGARRDHDDVGAPPATVVGRPRRRCGSRRRAREDARLVVPERRAPSSCSARARRRRASRRARRRAPRSRRRGRGGARSAPPPCLPARCRRPSRAAAPRRARAPSCGRGRPRG